jgi:hypothetical protein
MVTEIPVRERESRMPATREFYKVTYIPIPKVLQEVLEELGYLLVSGYREIDNDGYWFMIRAEKPFKGNMVLAFYYSLKPDYLNPQTWAIVPIGNSKVLEQPLLNRIKPIEVKKARDMGNYPYRQQQGTAGKGTDAEDKAYRGKEEQNGIPSVHISMGR